MKKILKFILISIIIIIVGVSMGNFMSNKNNEQNKQKEEQVTRINKWFNDEYVPSQPLYYEDGNFDNYAHQLRAIKGFKLSGDNILVVIYKNNMEAEGFTVEDLVTRGYSALLRYGDKEKLHFDNFDSDDYVNKKPSKYDVYYE